MSGGMVGRRGESLGGRPNVVCLTTLGSRRKKSAEKNRKRSAMDAGHRFGWRFLGLDASLARCPQPDWSKHKQSLHPPVNPPLWVRLRGNPRPLANQEIQIAAERLTENRPTGVWLHDVAARKESQPTVSDTKPRCEARRWLVKG